jgi:hypothetical protein
VSGLFVVRCPVTTRTSGPVDADVSVLVVEAGGRIYARASVCLAEVEESVEHRAVSEFAHVETRHDLHSTQSSSPTDLDLQ